MKKIKQIKNKNKEDQDIALLYYRLFDYLIRNQSNNLVFGFHHRYQKLFNINYSDTYNNGNTLLIIETKENSLYLVKYFVNKGANPLQMILEIHKCIMLLVINALKLLIF